MKIATKSVATLLLVTAVASAVPGISRLSRSKRQESKFDRLLQRHDRKGELRAEILGLDPLELRAMQKRMAFGEIVRRRGFADEKAFRLALLGKLKDELHRRGWTPQRIERYMTARSGRLG